MMILSECGILRKQERGIQPRGIAYTVEAIIRMQHVCLCYAYWRHERRTKCDINRTMEITTARERVVDVGEVDGDEFHASIVANADARQMIAGRRAEEVMRGVT